LAELLGAFQKHRKVSKSNSTAKRSVFLSKSIDFFIFKVVFGLLKIILNLPLLFLTNYKKTTIYKPLLSFSASASTIKEQEGRNPERQFSCSFHQFPPLKSQYLVS